MARAGGPANLAGVDYQLLYTATRFAEAITTHAIATLRPEAHLSNLRVAPATITNAAAPQPAKPSVDDLLVNYHGAPSDYISLKYRSGEGSWTLTQLISRGILSAFYRQHDADPSARLLLISETSADGDITSCLERLRNHETTISASDLTQGPLKFFIGVEDFINAHDPGHQPDDLRQLTHRFLKQVYIQSESRDSLSLILGLYLQPHTANASHAALLLTQLALQAGIAQNRLTPDDIRAELQAQGQPLIIPPDAGDVLDQLRLVSSSLTSASHTIGNAPSYHFNRPEIDAIVEWVLSPLPSLSAQASIYQHSKIITGSAGIGKTAALRDLCLALQSADIPVLGLKADIVHGPTKGALLTSIAQAGLTAPLHQALSIVATATRPAVVIFDQLDALSQLLSTDHGALGSYTQLLTDLASFHHHIRFVFSCRSFDLEHDSDLAPFKNADKVEIPLLTLSQVREGLHATHTAPNSTDLSPALCQLLRVPLHLSLYCALDPDARRGAPITSLQHLFDRLLDFLTSRKRLPTAVSEKQFREYLTSLANEMHRRQALVLPSRQSRKQDPDSYDYACSLNVLIEVGLPPSQVTFFHQSFGEFLFARHFVDDGKALAPFILNSTQGFFFRSLVQQVASYLRAEDFNSYLREVRALFTSPNCRFHYQLLLIQQLASQATPHAAEWSLVTQLILPDEVRRLAFVEAVTSLEWWQYLTQSEIVQQLFPASDWSELNRFSRTYFSRLTEQAPGLALPLLNTLPSHVRQLLLELVLNSLKDFSHPLFPVLFAEHFGPSISDEQQFYFWHLVEEATTTAPEWAADLIYQQLAIWPDLNTPDGQREAYAQASAINTVNNVAPTIGFNLCARLLRRWVRQADYYRNSILDELLDSTAYLIHSAPLFINRNPSDRENPPSHAPDAVLHHTWTYLTERSKARTLTDNEERTVRKWLFSRTNRIMQTALAAAAADPTPYTDALLSLFTKPGFLGQAAGGNHTRYYTLTLFPTVWDAATPSQRKRLALALTHRTNMVNGLKHVTRNKEGKLVWVRNVYYGWSTLRYLLALTPVRFNTHPELATLYPSLVRKWGILANDLPGPSVKITRGSGSAALKWNTEKVSPQNWLNALRKYRNAPREHRFNGRDYQSLIYHLTRLIEQQPTRWLPTLQLLVDVGDESVSQLLPALHQAIPTASASLVDAALTRNLLSFDEVRRIRRLHSPSLADSFPARAAYIQAELADLLANLDTPPTTGRNKLDLVTHAINSAGGRAAAEVLSQTPPPKSVPAIVSAFKRVAEAGAPHVRAGALQNLAMFLNTSLPLSDIVHLLVTLIGNNYELIESASLPLQYLIWRDYPTVMQLLRAAISDPSTHKLIVQLLAFQWGEGKPGALELLQDIFTLNPEVQGACLRFISRQENEFTPEFIHRALEFFANQPTSKELRAAQEVVFARLTPDSLPALFTYCQDYLLKRYQNINDSHPIERYSDSSLLHYLANSSRQYPAQCIELLEILFQQLPRYYSYYPADRAMRVLLEALTTLTNHFYDTQAQSRALDLFDDLLTRPDCRANLESLLAE